MNLRTSFALSLFSCLTAMPAFALELESKPTRTHLLELYTSEGCSSCPPAEAWLSKLKTQPRLWQDFVPVAFHVDYWDRLGWRDPFAAKAWTARQYAYSARWQSSSVYTPGFVLDGREWRESLPNASNETVGVLKLAIDNGETVHASFRPADGKMRPLDVYVARLGFDINSNVKAGENSGRNLRHDFVILALATEKMAAGQAELRLPPPSPAPPANARAAVIAWVTEPGQIEPLQAVGGWLQ
ncbi:MAG: DUF1223 domain-containing protein [Verrucomicrobiota bacterium]|nr:DUF1223 domain-containing protein [Verrucomicrobiota bacterium]